MKNKHLINISFSIVLSAIFCGVSATPLYASGPLRKIAASAARNAAEREAARNMVVKLGGQTFTLSETSALKVGLLNLDEKLAVAESKSISTNFYNAFLPEGVYPELEGVNNELILKNRIQYNKDVSFLKKNSSSLLANIEREKFVINEALPIGKYFSGKETLIFIGERHYDKPIRQEIEKLILGYQARFPQREIILLSEFVWDTKRGKDFDFRYIIRTRKQLDEAMRVKSHLNFYASLIEKDVKIVGLENFRQFNPFISSNSMAETNMKSENQEMMLAGSAEGIRMRNIHWNRRIAQARELYPDAVFIVHTGNEHIVRSRAYSLPNLTNENATVVSVLTPKAINTIYNYYKYLPPEIFADIKDIQFNNVPMKAIFRWKRPEFSRVMGNDVLVVVKDAPKIKLKPK